MCVCIKHKGIHVSSVREIACVYMINAKEIV